MLILKGNNILIEKVEIENKSSGGIILPNDSNIDIKKGKVITVSVDDVNGYYVGDIVSYQKSSYTMTIQYENKTYLVLRIEDIVSIERN